MNLRQPQPHHVRLHHPLPWDVFDARGSLLLRKGYVLTEERQRETLLERGLYVEEGELRRHEAGQAPAPREFDPFHEWSRADDRLGLILREHITDSNFVRNLTQLAQDIDVLSGQDPDAGLYIVTRQPVDRYPIAHALQTAFVSGLIGRRMGMSPSERIVLQCAALSMNVAMIELQKTLHRQAGPLTEAQLSEVRSHPIRSWQRLEMAGVTSEDWLRAVAQHHEAPDGTGYPSGLSELFPLAEVIHYADRYCAMIVDRAGRRAMPANQVARELFVAATGCGSSVGALVVKELGLYPPGNFVRLCNGEVAVVVQRGERANAPEVCAVQDRDGVRYPEPVRRNTARPEYAVVEIVSPETVFCELDGGSLFGYPRPASRAG